MKKVLKLILFLNLITTSVICQEYLPIVKEGNSWNMLSVIYIPGDPLFDTSFSTITYKIFEDTVINGSTYHIISSSTEELCNSRTSPHEKVRHEFTSTFFNNQNVTVIEGHADKSDYNFNEFPPAGYFFEPSEEKQTIQFVDSLKVKGVWYQNVWIITTGVNKYYWAKNIGLIKKSMHRDISMSSDTLFEFELVRYKLN